MPTSTTYPKIKSVKPEHDKTLLVEFESGEHKVYDCKPLLECEVFRPLQDEALFRCAHADSRGYGVIWNDDIDLAESEIWLNGRTAEPRSSGDAGTRA